MNDRTRAPQDEDPIGSPTTPRSGRGPGQGQGGPNGNPSGPRDANDPGSTRYGHNSGSGANRPKDSEQKEGTVRSRQGGDETAEQPKKSEEDER